eukprot:gene11571-21806_t
MTVNEFSVADYIVFACMLLISSAIGVYHAYGGKQSTTKEYLMAGKGMGCFPIFVSLLASYLSAITLLGVPSEIYTYGVQYCVLLLSYFILCTVAAVIYAPIFYRLDITSAHEYLEMRFSPGVRSLGCFLFMLQYLLYLSVVLYAPSLALEAVAGVPLTATIITTGLVCNFYTTLGGMKAVIWTDVFQAGVMLLGLIVVLIVGTMEVGGFGTVFDRAEKGQRLKVFDFNPDPRVRNTFWTLSIGGAFTAMPVWTVSQTAVQRFLSAKSLRTAQRSLYLCILGLVVIVTLCVMDGLVIYANYNKCDLKKDGRITSNDQVLPYFIIDHLGAWKGIPGLFTSCLFSGALSTASSGLNSIAAVTLEDIVKRVHPGLSDAWSTRISKIIACTFGMIIIGGAFLVSFVGTMVLQLAYSIFGIVGGPCLGIFALGMLVPSATWKGAYCGAFVGVTTTLWLAIGAQVYPPNKFHAPVSVEQCPRFLVNQTYVYPANFTKVFYNKFTPHDTNLASFYSISYLWYAAIGVTFTFVAGVIFSWVFGPGNPDDVDPKLLFDYKGFFWSILPRKFRPARYNFRQSSEDFEAEMKSPSGGIVLVTLTDKEDAKVKEAEKERKLSKKDEPGIINHERFE